MSYFFHCQALELQIRGNDDGPNKAEPLQEKENLLNKYMNAVRLRTYLIHLSTQKSKQLQLFAGGAGGS